MIEVMSQAAPLNPLEKVLDVGTGSGHQAAALAHIIDSIIGVERIPALIEGPRVVIQHLTSDTPMSSSSKRSKTSLRGPTALCTTRCWSLHLRLVCQMRWWTRSLWVVGSWFPLATCSPENSSE